MQTEDMTAPRRMGEGGWGKTFALDTRERTARGIWRLEESRAGRELTTLSMASSLHLSIGRMESERGGPGERGQRGPRKRGVREEETAGQAQRGHRTKTGRVGSVGLRSREGKPREVQDRAWGQKS